MAAVGIDLENIRPDQYAVGIRDSPIGFSFIAKMFFEKWKVNKFLKMITWLYKEENNKRQMYQLKIADCNLIGVVQMWCISSSLQVC